ncbi:MAG: hypothetical protein ACXW4B_11195 [Micavibrio sp.]
MTDSTPPSFPTTPRAADSPAPLSRGEIALKILSASGDLQNLRRPTRVEGEVTKISRDGTTATIETEQGAIEVRLRERIVLQPGQKVEIDLPAGQPPRQVVLRPAPVDSTQSAPLPVTPQPASTGPDLTTPQTQVQTQVQTPAQNTTAQIPMPPEIRESLDQLMPLPLRPIPQNPAPLPANSIVRLVPLSALPHQTALLPLPIPLPATLPELAIQASTVYPSPPGRGQGEGSFLQIAVISPYPNPLPKGEGVGLAPLLGGEGDLNLLLQKFVAQTNWSATTPTKPSLTFQILPPITPLSSVPTLMTAVADFAPLQKPSIALPLIKQIQPFIIPLTAQPVPVPDQKFDMRVMAIEPGLPDMVQTVDNAGKPQIIANSPITITANVVATTTDHFPVLSMLWPGHDKPDSFTLQFPATNMPVGTQIELSPPTAPLPGLAPVIPASATPPMTLLTGWTWPVFDETLNLLGPAGMPAPTAQSFANILPSPAAPTQMPAAILFFMAAIGAGDLPGWLGEKALTALRREGAKGNDLIQRLTRDIAGLTRMMDEPVTQDWKAMALPMLWQNEITKINLFYRHQDTEKENDKDEQGDRSTRFLFDLHLKRIGPLQLDGFMKAKRLDLIVRTKTPFSHAMQSDMRRLYLDTLGKGLLTGELGFQNRMDQWVSVDVRQAELQTTA